MSGFDWRTENEGGWDEGDWESGPRPPSRRRRPWTSLLLLVLVLGVSGAVVYQQVTQRVEEANDSIRNDLLSSYNLLLTSVVNDDPELFDTVLSGRDLSWTSVQRSLFLEGMVVERAELRMEPDLSAPAPGGQIVDESTIELLEFSSNLLEAHLVVKMPYLVAGADGMTVTAHLKQAMMFRRGQNRWLLSPPDAGFWGERVRLRESRVLLDYPQQDGEMARRLGIDLNRLVESMCQEFDDLGCPDAMQLEIFLATNPASLLTFGDTDSLLEQGLELALPALMLTGIPADDASYELVYQAYAKQVAAAVIAHLVGWECCSQAGVFYALVEYQLNQLGLGSWPISPEAYKRVVDEGVEISELARMWSVRRRERLALSDGWMLYILADFLIHRFPEVPVSEMQRQMGPGKSFQTWLSTLFGPHMASGQVNFLLNDLGQEWWDYASRTVAQAQEPPPIPLPAEDIMLVCGQTIWSPTGLARFEFREAEWNQVLSVDGIIYVGPLPGNDGLLMSTLSTDDDGSADHFHLEVLQDGVHSVLQTDSQMLASIGQIEPATGRLVVYNVTSAEQGTEISLLDMGKCTTGDCERTPLPGPIVWSPGGSRAIVSVGPVIGSGPLWGSDRVHLFSNQPPRLENQLYLVTDPTSVTSSSDELENLGFGLAPLWLDEDTYVFVRARLESSYYPDEQLILGSVASGEQEALFGLEEMRAAVSDAHSSLDFVIIHAAATPSQPELIYVLVEPVSEFELRPSYLLLYDRRTGLLTTQMSVDEMVTSLGFSPDGRWLVISATSIGEHTPAGILYLLNVSSGETISYPTIPADSPIFHNYEWSPDSSWLAILSGLNSINLAAPDYDHTRYLPAPRVRCSSLTWSKP